MREALNMKRLLALGSALGMVAVSGTIYVNSAPSYAELEKMAETYPVYGYPQAGELEDPDILASMIKARTALGDNPRLLMGSSELDIIEPASSHPDNFFGKNNYGFSTISVGKAGYQSLWQAIELGALDAKGAVPGDKVALIAGMQWFMNDEESSKAFMNCFSADSYQSLMHNPSISEKTKQELSLRAEELGIAAEELELYSSSFLPDVIDRKFDDLVNGVERRNGIAESLKDNTAIPESRFTPESEPDWNSLTEISLEEAESSCVTNELGVYDEYYEKYYRPWVEEIDQSSPPETFYDWSENELKDFEIFLKVCKDTGIEPLIIIMPVKASYYDLTEHNYESRQAYYDMIRNSCESYEVQYLDLSPYEYDTYFMRDVMHLGWTGWIHVDQALYDFFKQEDN